MDKELKAYLDNQFKQIDQRFEHVENRLDTLESIQLRMENKFSDQLRIIFDKIVQIDDHMANQAIHVMPTI